jgi:hypothetical protein
LFLGVLSWIHDKDSALRMARERARFAIITNGEQVFAEAVRDAGWKLEKEIIAEVLGADKTVPIGLYV